MMTEAPPSGQNLGSLVKGIVSDVGDHISKQFQFANAELKQDMRRTGEATLSLAIGAGVAFVGLLSLTWMVVHLLHWLTTPRAAADPAGLPLWACFGLVGLAFLTPGAILLLKGKKKLDSFNPLPDETVKSIKENIEWTTNSK